MRLLVAALGAMALLAPAVLAGPAYSFDLLANVRSNITVFPMSVTERTSILKSVWSLFQIYVNREAKIATYGDEYPDIDPIPRVNSLLNNNSALSDLEFHYALSNIFLSQRVFHTNYYIPGVHTCYFVVTALDFEFVKSKNIETSPTVLVKGFTGSGDVMMLSESTALAKVAVGDKLVSINGHSFVKYFEANKWRTGGASVSGGHRSALASLQIRSGRYFPMPEENALQLVLQSRATKHKYNLTLPWVAVRDESCFAEVNSAGLAQRMRLRRRDSRLPLDRTENVPPKLFDKAWVDRVLKQAEAPHLAHYKQFFPAQQFADAIFEATDDPSISWAIYKPNTTRLGILRIENFQPLQSDATQATLLIRDVLVSKLNGTKALVIDLRDNPGGIITLPDYLPQLFGQSFTPAGARLVVNDINTYIVNSTMFPNDDFKSTYLATPPEQKYTQPVAFDSASDSYQYGQAYFRAMGVLTNGQCYSACDIFAANIQDNEIGLVFGEDASTGAGGANVVEHNAFLLPMDPRDFGTLPRNLLLGPSTAQDLRVAWRQFVRVGSNAGALIEDRGVVSDVVVRPIPADLFHNRTYQSQWETVAKRLKQVNIERGTTKTSLIAEPLFRDMVVGSAIEIGVRVGGMTRLALLDGDQGGEIGSLDLPEKAQHHAVSDTLQSRDIVTQLRFKRYEIHGFIDGTRVARTVRYVRFVPLLEDRAPVTNTTTWTWNFTAQPNTAIYNYDSSGDKGSWRIENSTLVVGRNGEYANNADSIASFFFAMPQLMNQRGSGPVGVSGGSTIQVAVKGVVNTESGYDFVVIGFRAADQSLVLKRVSGDTPLDAVATFPAPADGLFEVFVGFTSDSSVAYAGATITALSVSSI
ncbi:hypothetical protein HK105_206021 [Polyrhizophydium stewartii]|uniref:Tail specific protease domain-containing protein n=1 Tax=Polyrhizophydium stewartii TaxID=2732419 RepID=A0ABR4N4P1_9FUNG